MNSLKKILILTGYFRQGFGYQENVWAEQLAQRGYKVRVVTAGRRLKAKERISGSTAMYEVKTVPTIHLPRGVYLSSSVGAEIHQFEPDLVLWMGVAQYFGLDLVRQRTLFRIPLATFFSENIGMHEFDWRKRGIRLQERLHAIGYHVLRGPIIRRACLKSTLIIGNCPQTRACLLRLFKDPSQRGLVNRRIIDVPLGFNPDDYFYDADTRQNVRAELGYSEEDIVVCVSSRFAPGKKRRTLETSFQALRSAMLQSPWLKVLIVGMQDNATSRYFRDYLTRGQAPERITFHDFADQSRLNMLYNAGDIIIFGNATISCSAALATGLVVCLADNGTMTHLVQSPKQSLYFRPGDPNDLAHKLVTAGENIRQRRELHESKRCDFAKAQRRLGYDQIITNVMGQIEQHAHRHNRA